MILSLHYCSTVRTRELESFAIFSEVLTNFFFSTELFLESLVDIWFSSLVSLDYFLLLSIFSCFFLCVYMCSRNLSFFLISFFPIFFQVCLNFFPIGKVFLSLFSSFLVLESTYKFSATRSTLTRFYSISDSTRM